MVTSNPVVVHVYDNDWKLVRTITFDSKIQYALVAYDSSKDRLIVLTAAEDSTVQVSAYDTDGKVTDSFASPMTNKRNAFILGGLAVTKDGNIVFGYGGSSRSTAKLDDVYAVRTYKPDGTLVNERRLDYFQEDEATQTGMETFRFFPVPYGLIVDNSGRVYAYEVQVLPPVNYGEKARTSGLVTISAPNGTVLRQFPVSQKDSPVNAKLALSPDQKTLYVATMHFVNVLTLTKTPTFTTVQVVANARLRSAADKTATPVGSAKAGTVLIVTGKNEAGDWLKVRFKGADAWIAASSTQPVGQ